MKLIVSTGEATRNGEIVDFTIEKVDSKYVNYVLNSTCTRASCCRTFDISREYHKIFKIRRRITFRDRLRNFLGIEPFPKVCLTQSATDFDTTIMPHVETTPVFQLIAAAMDISDCIGFTTRSIEIVHDRFMELRECPTVIDSRDKKRIRFFNRYLSEFVIHDLMINNKICKAILLDETGNLKAKRYFLPYLAPVGFPLGATKESQRSYQSLLDTIND